MGPGAPTVVAANTHLFVVDVYRSEVARFYIVCMSSHHSFASPLSAVIGASRQFEIGQNIMVCAYFGQWPTYNLQTVSPVRERQYNFIKKFGIQKRLVIFGDNILSMARQIIFHGDYFTDFYKGLDIKVKQKVKYVFELIKQVDRVPEKFLSPMTGYDGLYEIRIEYQSNIYRVFCCFDEGKLIVLFNGFQKKTQKTPMQEIEKAMKIKAAYFESKK